MGVIESLKALLFPSAREEEARREADFRRLFKSRCKHFKALLSANKRALTGMAALEEALQGDQVFGMSFVRATSTVIVSNVFNMVRHLDALSSDSYPELADRVKAVQQDIAAVLSPKHDSYEGPLVLPLAAVDFSLADEVGVKMASLGEAHQKLGQVIPLGFVVTASGYRRFIEANDLREEINRRMQITDTSNMEDVFALSSSLQRLIVSATVPDDLAAQITAAYAEVEKTFPDARLAVRSSAIGEDALGSSFAGQYRSDLNVTGEALLDTYKEVVASKYGVAAMSYRVNRGIPDEDVPMCVGCLHMVEASVGGVAYSQDPMHDAHGVVVNSVPGLPRLVVDGGAEIDEFVVSREEPHSVLSSRVPVKPYKLVSVPGGGVTQEALLAEEGAKPSLSEERLALIARTAMAFERFYGQPQDIEWAFGPKGRLVILQSRPLMNVTAEAHSSPLPPGAEPLLEGGVCASSGAGFGQPFIVRRDADMLRFPRGAVLVVEQAHARWAPVLSRASAVVSEFGGMAGHLASVAREYGVPALLGVKDAVRVLSGNGAVSGLSGKDAGSGLSGKDAVGGLSGNGEITVDADNRRVLPGKVEELLSKKAGKRKKFAASPVYALLEQVAQHIVPLHLLDPDAAEFSPAHCRTLHDITRFCHEKAVYEMFRPDMLESSLFSNQYGKQLKFKGSKLQYFIINIEHGFCSPIEGRYVELQDICCPPMHAIWQGMVAIPWNGPAGATGRSFLSLVAESAGNPELEITSASTRMLRNYFLVDRDYCNLQASFGFHFCTIEAQAGNAEQENYVNFHFKGGAANMGRRVLRVQALADVLAENGFLVEIKEDALSARAEELLASEVLELLAILGYIIVHTRQMDAALSGEASRAALADMLRQGIAQVMKGYIAESV